MSDVVDIETSIAHITGLHALASEGAGKALVVALHGGGFSSAYYRQPGFAFVDALQEQGIDAVFLDRPGYGGSRFHEHPDKILDANAEALSEAVSALWKADRGKHTGVTLVGHSIGGAIALMMGAKSRDWPLLGISVSGIGERPPAELSLPADDGGAAAPLRLPEEMVAALFFKPGAATSRALAAVMAAGEAIVPGEAAEIYRFWPQIAPTVLAGITAPVQMVFAAHETLWDVREDSIERIRSALTSAPLIDMQTFADVGHCIEFHPQSADFYRHVLAFCQRC